MTNFCDLEFPGHVDPVPRLRIIPMSARRNMDPRKCDGFFQVIKHPPYLNQYLAQEKWPFQLVNGVCVPEDFQHLFHLPGLLHKVTQELSVYLPKTFTIGDWYFAEKTGVYKSQTSPFREKECPPYEYYGRKLFVIRPRAPAIEKLDAM